MDQASFGQLNREFKALRQLHLACSQDYNSSGKLDDIKIGALADYLPIDKYHAGLTVWDRDAQGLGASSHNSTGYDNWIIPDVYMQNRYAYFPAAASPGFVGQGSLPPVTGYGGMGPGPLSGMLSAPNPNNITNGWTVFQGVRTYDPTAGAWTTPDAFAGTIQDPMSQKSYVYNRANPVAYADPTGFGPAPIPSAFGYPSQTADLAGEGSSDLPESGYAAMHSAFDPLIISTDLALSKAVSPSSSPTNQPRDLTPIEQIAEKIGNQVLDKANGSIAPGDSGDPEHREAYSIITEDPDTGTYNYGPINVSEIGSSTFKAQENEVGYIHAHPGARDRDLDEHTGTHFSPEDQGALGGDFKYGFVVTADHHLYEFVLGMPKDQEIDLGVLTH